MNRREDLVALALLLLLVIAAFANVVFDGRSLVPSDNLSPLKPQIVPPAEWLERGLLPHPNYRDQPAATQQGEASQQFLRQSLENGEFPFWDPYLGGGAPSFASMIPGYLFPPGFLVALLGAGSGVKNFYILLLILASGTLTYFFLRRFTSHWNAALVGAIAFAFSGAIIQTTPSFIGQALAFFALPLLVTDRLLQAPNGRRAAQLALAFAFVATTVIAKVVDRLVGLRVTAEDEETGTDLTQHGEIAYTLRERPRSPGRGTADLSEEELIELQERLVVRAAERVLATISADAAPPAEPVGTSIPDPLD